MTGIEEYKSKTVVVVSTISIAKSYWLVNIK